MAGQWAFFFNSDACSGCKTCQVACKDKNDLPQGVHWRKVTEVTGGKWELKNGLWQSSVAAYNVSMACCHCQNPPCLPACPTKSIWKREDGIVFIDETNCTRCRLCETVCPYGAIRYDAVSMIMTKCDFCADELGRGLAPACVAACPNRALDFGDLDDLKKKYGAGACVFPLPDPAEPKPALVLKPHRNAEFVGTHNPEIANWAEI
jgi:anaerobic dimethyl sulfoxide reductase subunit B (iron-sulfur subunit)